MNQKMAPYDNYETSIARLKQGFIATKYNYSNDKIQKVNVRLSDDC